MENKLKELTDRLYGEGLEKGRVEADRLVAEAKEKAAAILAEANAEAEQIVKKAEAKAADTEKNSMTEIQLAGRQAVAKIKSELAGVIIAKTSSEAVKAATVDAEFVKKMLLEVAKNWTGAAEQVSLKALLPAALEAEFAKVFEASANELLAAGVEVGYSRRLSRASRLARKRVATTSRSPMSRSRLCSMSTCARRFHNYS